MLLRLIKDGHVQIDILTLHMYIYIFTILILCCTIAHLTLYKNLRFGLLLKEIFRTTVGLNKVTKQIKVGDQRRSGSDKLPGSNARRRRQCRSNVQSLEPRGHLECWSVKRKQQHTYLKMRWVRKDAVICFFSKFLYGMKLRMGRHLCFMLWIDMYLIDIRIHKYRYVYIYGYISYYLLYTYTSPPRQIVQFAWS